MGWAKVFLWGLLAAVSRAGADQTIMKDVTMGFGAALDSCRAESGLTEDMMEEFFHLWDEGFNFEARELGCAIYCMTRYFNLVTDADRLHHENMEKFIKTFPNGEKLAKDLVAIIHQCEKQFYDEKDQCWRVLHIAECFTVSSRARGLAPTMEMLLAEIIMQGER